MSAIKNIALTDFVDVLNEKSNEINQYEGFYPSKYLIVDDSTNEMTIRVVPTTADDSSKALEIKVNKLNPYDKDWFEHCAEAQIAVYQSVIDVMKTLNKDNKFYKLGADGRYHVASKKTNKNNAIQDEFLMIQLSTFVTLEKFRNYSIASVVKPKNQETIESVKAKTSSLVNSIRDSIARLRFIDNTPNFNLVAQIADNKIGVEISLNNEKILSFTNDWTKIDLALAYNRLVSLCYASLAISNTLGCFQQLVGINDPRLFVSKAFSKKWRITDAGNQYLTCLEISNLIKEMFNFKQVA